MYLFKELDNDKNYLQDKRSNILHNFTFKINECEFNEQITYHYNTSIFIPLMSSKNTLDFKLTDEDDKNVQIKGVKMLLLIKEP